MFFFSKADELAKLTGVEVCLIVKDGMRFDTFFSKTNVFKDLEQKYNRFNVQNFD